VHYLNNVSASVGSVLTPAGWTTAVGIITASYLKDPTDPQFQKGKEWEDWLAWMKKYTPDGDLKDVFNVYGYTVAQGLVQVLKQAGDNLTRENVMKQAREDRPDDFYPIEREQLARFDGKTWVLSRSSSRSS
jgi:branched-chain amino acid transport system substrate-binding protein